MTFTCKDRTLARYCELEFGKRFQADLDATPPEKRSELLGRWKEILYSEAMRQEWYDYILDDQGKRHPIYEPVRRPPNSVGGKVLPVPKQVPKLLVPTVVMT